MADLLLSEAFTYVDGSRVLAEAYGVPETERFPRGIKYRFQYTAPDGRTLLRYDNAHGDHDRHREDEVEQIAFNSLGDHYRRFRAEVETIYDRRTD